MTEKSHHHRRAAFTLVEVVVSIAVLALLVALIGQLFNNTSAASSISTNHLEADARVRLLFSRMASDFSHIVKRTDVDYYLKSPTYLAWPYSSTPYNTADNSQLMPVYANDQMAFFTSVSGYLPSTLPATATLPENAISLVSYRLNNTGTAPSLERLSTGLSWGSNSYGVPPMVFLPTTITGTWPYVVVNPPPATSATNYDPDYETIVPNAFRFEYYYLLTNGTLSVQPWVGGTGHSAINGLQDVVGIGVVVAVTDRKASAIATSASLQGLAASMADWSSTSTPNFGNLQTSWQNTVNASTLTAPVKDGIRIYEQLFSINTPSQ